MTLAVQIGATDVDTSDGPAVIWWAIIPPARIVEIGIIRAEDLQEVADEHAAGPSPRPPDR